MDKSEIEELEKVTGQLDGIYSEITILAKKAPNDAVNNFKLNFINKILASANELLGESYRPFPDFECFDTDDVPSNSDITFVLSQYREEVERLRADNIVMEYGYWRYIRSDGNEEIRTAPPAKVLKK